MKREQILFEYPRINAKSLDYLYEHNGRKIEIVHRFGHEGYQVIPQEKLDELAILEKYAKSFSDGYKGFQPHSEKWIVQKWKDPDMEIYKLQRKGYGLFDIMRKTGKAPYQIHIGHAIFPILKINGMLNEGIDEIWDHVDGTDVTNNYTNALARVGVGNSATAFAASQTGLQGGSTAFAAMDATYPTSTAQKINLKGSFPDTQAEFAWEEGTADNGSSPNNNLHRLVQSKGTKPSGETWTSESQLTGS